MLMARFSLFWFKDGKLGALQVGVMVRHFQPPKMKAAHVCDVPTEFSVRVRSYASRADDILGQDKSSSADVVGRPIMTFEKYRKLKKALRVRSRVSGVPMALVGASISSYINVYFNPRMFEMTPEEIQPILGMDPIVFVTLCGLGSGLVGYLLGGTIFTAMWRLVARKQFTELQQRDTDFLRRLQKHRYSEVNKYEDDYYGDKVMNLSDYRQWIRKQHKRKEDLLVQTAQPTSKVS